MLSEADYWKTAGEVCTEKELETLRLSRRHGMSLRSISLALDVSVSTVRQRLANADRKIELALRKEAA